MAESERQRLGLCLSPDPNHDCVGEVVSWLLYRAAETREGPRWAEALRGANAARQGDSWLAWTRGLSARLIAKHEAEERLYGCPVGFRTILDNRETPRATL